MDGDREDYQGPRDLVLPENVGFGPPGVARRWWLYAVTLCGRRGYLSEEKLLSRMVELWTHCVSTIICVGHEFDGWDEVGFDRKCKQKILLWVLSTWDPQRPQLFRVAIVCFALFVSLSLSFRIGGFIHLFSEWYSQNLCGNAVSASPFPSSQAESPDLPRAYLSTLSFEFAFCLFLFFLGLPPFLVFIFGQFVLLGALFSPMRKSLLKNTPSRWFCLFGCSWMSSDACLFCSILGCTCDLVRWVGLGICGFVPFQAACWCSWSRFMNWSHCLSRIEVLGSLWTRLPAVVDYV